MDYTTSKTKFHVFTSSEIKRIFDDQAPIYFDTNILLQFWKMHTNPRKVVIEKLETLKSRLYLPSQVELEVHSKSYDFRALSEANFKKTKEHLQQALKEALNELNKAKPLGTAGASQDDIDTARKDTEKYFDDLEDYINALEQTLKEWLGEPIDKSKILRGDCENYLLKQVLNLFDEGHILKEVSAEQREKYISEYQIRISSDIPLGPGASDQNKESNSEGDFVIWREILEHCKENDFNRGFILVTNEKKADFWEEKQTLHALRRVDPRLQEEAIRTTGGPLIIINFEELINLLTSDANERQMLNQLSEDSSLWSQEAYNELLVILESNGYEKQSKVIREAARLGGYISRAEIQRVLDWGDENRYLTRFRMPADRIFKQLIDSGDVPASASPPLEATYSPGSSEATGYSVPTEFGDFYVET